LGKGTGLGLSTVLGIVKSHGGHLNVQSEVGKSTRFDIYLPAIAAEESPVENQPRPALPRGMGEGVLIVDDEISIREVVSSMLRYCGYKPFAAESGLTGLEIYRKHRDEISLALVDMMMPGIDGINTMRLLRELNPKLAMIALSGMLDNDQITTSAGFTDVELLRKPITAASLLGKIASTLASRPKE
jgi:CheY-like chemotaxis protein